MLKRAPEADRSRTRGTDWRVPGAAQAEFRRAEAAYSEAAAEARKRRGDGWYQWAQSALSD
eukprot:8078049-Lingulodinium_polyedra.AAC.1